MVDASDGDFEFPEDIIRLKFEGTELAGLVIETTSISVEGLLDIQEKSAAVEEMRKEAQSDTAKNRIMMKEFRALIDLFADVIVSWNVKKKGEPQEPTAANLMKMNPTHLFQMINLWVTLVGGVDQSLGEGLQLGDTMVVVPDQMAAL
jgi:hypothetical protein